MNISPEQITHLLGAHLWTGEKTLYCEERQVHFANPLLLSHVRVSLHSVPRGQLASNPTSENKLFTRILQDKLTFEKLQPLDYVAPFKLG